MTESDQEILSALKEKGGLGEFSDIEAHLSRDAVFLVSPALTLEEVALAVAKDKSSQVEAWIHRAQVSRPREEQIENWRKGSQKLQTMIVAPFVFVQEPGPIEGNLS
ncbi:MAG: DUF2288 domain-containing protein [Polyangiaceae bacterium]|nr:DUF2288 domain-containing protein [Polyangiaceae bacterium]